MDQIKNPDARNLILAYLTRIAALDSIASGKVPLSTFIKAERDLWYQLLSNPHGSMFAGMMGGAVITWADAVLSIQSTEESAAKVNMGLGAIALVEAAVQLVLRVEGGETVAIRKAINDKLVALSAEVK